ncbi:transcription factor IIF subunit TFG2 [Sugiyamaella lignohabitans]|uniref:Transcription initiation factor IIF subunit beta n=1 Tax=Sugiyamaella lignohabitans TaxID=796027 RepID=A0A167C0J4_9ASCO|nr:transcription factor IIF subunit TFG2 [Sugiyamaella lignohabitans]ANB11065.1 transcription factor IIF subunit TFG2 [Sugiyamaella lignohabitans]
MSAVDVKEEPGSPGFEDDVSLSPSSPRPSGSLDDQDVPTRDGAEEEEEIFEDSLDLDTSGASSKVWLVRLPKFLMERWKDVDKISDSELGKVRIRNQQGNEPWKVKLVLNDTPETADIPHEYDISLVKQVVDNTFVFTEKDLPKFSKPQDKETTNPTTAAANRLAALNKAKNKYNNRKNYFKNSSPGVGSDGNNGNSSDSGISSPRFVPYVKTIPKKTALVGTACHECLVMPSMKDPNYAKVVSQRKALESESSAAKVTFLNEMPGVNAATFGQSLRNKPGAFIRSTKKDIAKSSEGKATRIPKNELLDLLFKLFEEYDYWSLKGLRERTKQPETYLKEVLDTMAILIKKGPYAMKYTLKPEFKQIKGKEGSLSEYMERTGANGDADNEPNGNRNENGNASGNDEPTIEDDEDDDDVEMETIL